VSEQVTTAKEVVALVGSLLRAESIYCPKTRVVDETLKRTNEKHSLVAAMRDGNRGLALLALPTKARILCLYSP